MKRGIVTLLGLFLIAAVSLVMAQAGPGGGGRRGARNYNPATETTVTGTVENVTQLTGQRGSAGTHLTLKTEQGEYDVHLGPASYLSAQQFTFAKGDKLEVVGSKTKVGGKDALIARQVTKDGKTLTLRDEQGFPKWSRAATPAK